ncbi:hypothetical protein K504DRAFT_531068 [Pleomassaria siparia CBS 279.74]|uniref:Uncharacterized protein n=1 Tax=Pleomassaria siparia CBS 279.74 TaxID=1314801 RepID=A0A6G1KN47_9PLEO|nr:hypothetical protein K504DRAFT_531068 [Pleomassaria siparia CBS 279.74]
MNNEQRYLGRNQLHTDCKRCVGLPIFCSIGSSGLVAGQMNPSTQRPRYIMTNDISAGLKAVAVVFVEFIWLLLRKRNAEKERRWRYGAIENGKLDVVAIEFDYTL